MIDFDALDLLAEQQQLNPVFRHLSTKFVPGEGDNAKAFVIGEAPGAQEEIQGRPFVGPAGIMLRRLMEFAQLTSDPEHPMSDPNCWLTNVVKFRPPRNRTPTNDEIECAKPYLMREWDAVGQPWIIVPVGGIALRAIMGRNISILKVAGNHIKKISIHNGQLIDVWPMVHPSFALRMADTQPGLKELLENHWIKLGKWIARR